MKPEIYFALGCLICLGISDFLYRWGQRFDLSPGPFMLLQNLAYIATALGLGVFSNDLEWSRGLIYGFANGWLAFLAFLFVLLAMSKGEVSRLIPVVRLNFAVTGLLTVIFLGETLNRVRLSALVLAIFAIVFMGGRRTDSSNGNKGSGYGFAIGAMLCFGLMGLLYKLGLGIGASPGAMVFAQSIGVFSLALPFAIYRGGSILVRGGQIWIPVICGVLTAISYVALATAFTFGDAVVVAPIAQLSFVLAIVLSIVFLGERLDTRKTIGVACAIGAVTLFTVA